MNIQYFIILSAGAMQIQMLSSNRQHQNTRSSIPGKH